MLLAPLTPMSLVVSMRWPPAKWSPVSWCSERTIENLSVICAWLGIQLGDIEPRHAASGWLPDAAIFGRGVRLHVVHIHVARTAVQPDEDDGRVFCAVSSGRRLGLARRSCGRPRPAKPAAPTWRKLRRLSPSQLRGARPRSMRSMGWGLRGGVGKGDRGGQEAARQLVGMLAREVGGR